MTHVQSGGPTAGRYLALFASLYAVQGVVVAYITNFNTNFMTSKGVSLDAAATAETIALLPLVFKFLIGPLSDRFSLLGLGHRIPYILLGVVLQSIGLVGLTTINPVTHLVGYGAMALLAVIGLAFYDASCDGMVLDVTPPSGRARTQGVLWVSRFLATTVCTFAFGRYLALPEIGQDGVPRILAFCALLGLIPLVLSARAPEQPRAVDAERFSWRALATLGLPWNRALLVFGGLYAMIALGAEFKLAPYYQELGYSPGGIGDLGSARYLGRATGALLLPVLAGRFSQRTLIVAGLLTLVATTASQSVIGGPSARFGPLSAGVAAFCFGLSNGWNDALFGVLAMQGSNPRLAASTFALIMAVSNFSIIGNSLFMTLVRLLGGFPAAYLAAAGSIVPLLLLVIPLGRLGPFAFDHREAKSETMHEMA